MKKDFMGRVPVVFYSLIAGLCGWFAVQGVLTALFVGNPSRMNHRFTCFDPSIPAWESVENDPEARRHYALNYWHSPYQRKFYTDGSLVFFKSASNRISEAPFGRPGQGSEPVEPFSYNSMAMRRFGIERDRLQLHQAAVAHEHHTMILPIHRAGRLDSQWAYDVGRQVLAGRITDLDNPRQADARIGFLGRNGLVQTRATADPLGDFAACQFIRSADTEETGLVLWQTRDSIYILDLNRREILLHKAWPIHQVQLRSSRAWNEPGRPVLKMNSVAISARNESGEWFVFMRTDDGTDRLYQGEKAATASVWGSFGMAGTDLYFQKFDSESQEIRKLPADEQAEKQAELRSRPWKEWAALYRVESDGSFTLVKRHEWLRDPKVKNEWVDTLPPSVVWVDEKLIRGTMPPAYAFMHHQLSGLGLEMIDSRVPPSRWKAFKADHFSRAYTHWQLLWTAVALGGLLLYQWKRKLSRGIFVAWTVFVMALGLAGLLACWIANRRKKGRTDPDQIVEQPQQVLIL